MIDIEDQVKYFFFKFDEGVENQSFFDIVKLEMC